MMLKNARPKKPGWYWTQLGPEMPTKPTYFDLDGNKRIIGSTMFGPLDVFDDFYRYAQFAGPIEEPSNIDKDAPKQHL